MIALTAALWLLVSPTAAADELSDAIGKSAYDAAAQSYLEGYLDVGRVTGEDWASGSAAILQTESSSLPQLMRGALKAGGALVAVALLYGMSRGARESLGGGELCPERMAACLAVCVISVGDVSALMGLGEATLERMDSFSKLLLPTVTAACAITGQGAAAAARQSAVLLFLTLLLTLARTLILPLIYGYIAASTAQAVLGNDGLGRVAGVLRWAATAALSLLLTAFVLSLSITAAVGGNADVAVRKAAKTALSGMVPVVGGILSDAAETLVAGAGVLRGTVGVVGLLAVLAICVGPFLRLGVHYLVYKCAAAVCATMEGGVVAGLIDAMAGAFALILGMTAGGGAMLYVALLTSIQAVGG